MAEPDNDPNAEQDLEADAHQEPAPPPLPYQPPGSPFPAKPTPLGPHNLSAPKQTPQTDFGQRLDTATPAQPKDPPAAGPVPTALP